MKHRISEADRIAEIAIALGLPHEELDLDFAMAASGEHAEELALREAWADDDEPSRDTFYHALDLYANAPYDPDLPF